MKRIIALSFCFIALSSAPALAHGKLKKSIPAKGAHLSEPPRELRFIFGEQPELKYTTVELRDTDGKIIELGPITTDSLGEPFTVVAQIKGTLGGGVYTVFWKMLGRDGHSVSGQFPFTFAKQANVPSGTLSKR